MNKLTIKLSILSLILSLSLSAEEDWSRVNTCKYSYGANDNLITELLSKMSIEQKVGRRASYSGRFRFHITSRCKKISYRISA